MLCSRKCSGNHSIQPDEVQNYVPWDTAKTKGFYFLNYHFEVALVTVRSKELLSVMWIRENLNAYSTYQLMWMNHKRPFGSFCTSRSLATGLESEHLCLCQCYGVALQAVIDIPRLTQIGAFL